MKDALIEGAGGIIWWSETRKRVTVWCGASDFVFCVLSWSVVDGGLGPAKRLPVCLVVIKVVRVHHQSWSSRTHILARWETNQP